MGLWAGGGFDCRCHQRHNLYSFCMGCSVPGDCMEIGRTRSPVCPPPRHLAVKDAVLLCKKNKKTLHKGRWAVFFVCFSNSGVATSWLWPCPSVYLTLPRNGGVLDNVALIHPCPPKIVCSTLRTFGALPERAFSAGFGLLFNLFLICDAKVRCFCDLTYTLRRIFSCFFISLTCL